MMVNTPNKYFLVKGSGQGNSLLNAFDFALLDAGVGDTNLVRMSSILPPKCQEISPTTLPFGALIPIAYAEISSNNKAATISAAVAVGIPVNDKEPGVIMEYEAEASLKEVEDVVLNMVKDAFAHRNRELKEIKMSSTSTVVENNASVFAGLVLWY